MATYYVKNAGNDSADGLSHGNAWKTISRINSFGGFVPGDSVLFRCGDVWEEQLTVLINGSSSSRFTIGAYDDYGPLGTVGVFGDWPGSLPKIDGSSPITGNWTPAPFGVFHDDFENGKSAAWNSSAGTVDTYANFSINSFDFGLSKCLSLPSAQMLYKDLTPSDEYYISLDYRVGSNDAARSYIATFLNGSTPIVEIMFNANPGTGTVPIRIYNRIANSQIGIGPTQYAVGSWVNIRIRVRIGLSDGSITVWVNGEQGLNYPSVNFGTNQITRIGVGSGTAGQVCYVKNVVIGTDDLTTSNRYKKLQSTVINSTSGTMVYEDGDKLSKVSSAMLVMAGSWWVGNGVLFLNCSDDATPVSHDMRISERNYCVSASGSDYIDIINLEMERSQNTCILFGGTAGNPSILCRAIGNYIHDSNYSGIAIVQNVDGVEITKNRIFYCHHAGTYANLRDVGTGPDGVLITRNHYRGNARQNIAIEEIDSGEISFNILEDCISDGVKSRSLEVDKTEGLLSIHHNLISGSEGACEYIQSFNGTVSSKNNIILNSGTTVEITAGANASNLESDHNLINGQIISSGITYDDDHFDDYVSTSGKDINSINNNPLFVSDSDYHLQPTSPCIGAGAAISGLTTDIEGNQLYPPYNIGPYGIADGALGVAPVTSPGPLKSNLTEISGPGAKLDPAGTYRLADTNAARVAVDFVYGVDHWAYNADGTPKTILWSVLIANGGGDQFFCGSKRIAGYSTAQVDPELTKIKRLTGV